MFALAVRLIVGAVAASVAATYAARAAQKTSKRRQAKNSNECQLCGEELSGDVRSMKCCGVKFHLTCLRAYVQSLDNCPIKCPCEPCSEVLILDEKEERAFGVPIPTERMYYCHHCDSIVTHTKPRVLPCTHRFCVGCIKQCMMAKVAVMGEEPRCPMEACRQLISEELHDSIMRME